MRRHVLNKLNLIIKIRLKYKSIDAIHHTASIYALIIEMGRKDK